MGRAWQVVATDMSFSRSQETEADLWGLQLLDARYGHVGGATDFFTRAAGEGAPSGVSAFFATPVESLDVGVVCRSHRVLQVANRLDTSAALERLPLKGREWPP